MKVVYTAMASKMFHLRVLVSTFVMKKDCVPINPFMNFDYFLFDKVKRESIIEANFELLKRCDELWVFGEISDGVQEEIRLAEKLHKTVRYFKVKNKKQFVEVTQQQAHKQNSEEEKVKNGEIRLLLLPQEKVREAKKLVKRFVRKYKKAGILNT